MTVIRRLIGIAVSAVPIVLTISSVCGGAPHFEFSRLAFGFAVAALAVAIFNIWLAFGRPLYLHWRYPAIRFPHVSGIPVVGNILAVWASIAGFGTLGAAVIALVSIVLDVGGLPWLVVLTWRDEGVWNPR